ncbi:MAG: DNA mismatch repair endonuclease MutL [Flammeovirgaceae bacterium]
MDIIRLLPESLANQIAAGEVVQRPASVVKELLENSLDAGASEIQLVVQDAGKTLIQVIDNGSGMSETDARMSFERHATSKIRNNEDLFNILTFGFRGEALASIAAVAQVEMKTRLASQEVGTFLRIEASEIKEHKAIACPKGTSFSVKNLFFNVPARRNFLKSNMVEFRHIVEEFQHIALAHPEVVFSLYHNEEEIYHLKNGNIVKRIVALLGKNYQENLIPCQEEVQHVCIQGFIGKPSCAKKTKGDQFFYVNNRYIKYPYLHHAVMSAFEGMIPSDHFPFYLLNITIDPKHVDVNVHPTKTEVKFDDERTVYAVMKAAVRQALAKYGIAPSLDFATDVNFTERFVREKPTENQFVSSKLNRFTNNVDEKRQSNNIKHWETLYSPIHKKEREEIFNEFEVEKTPTQLPLPSFEIKENSLNTQKTNQTVENQEEKKQMMQLHQKYILCQVRSGLMCIDQQAAFERVYFEKYSKLLEGKSGVSQKMLFPKTLHLSASDKIVLQEIHSDLQSLGFLIELQADKSYQLTAIPAEIPQKDASETLESIFNEMKQGASEVKIPQSQRLVKALAKRASSTARKILSTEEMQSLITQLFACPNPHFAPDGRKIVSMLQISEIEKLFDS